MNSYLKNFNIRSQIIRAFTLTIFVAVLVFIKYMTFVFFSFVILSFKYTLFLEKITKILCGMILKFFKNFLREFYCTFSTVFEFFDST